MEQVLKDALYSFIPAGKKGFEGLIAHLLSSITNQEFLLAKPGHQGGKDLQTNETLGQNIGLIALFKSKVMLMYGLHSSCI